MKYVHLSASLMLPLSVGCGDDSSVPLRVRVLAVAFMRRHLRGEIAMDPWLTGASVPSGITLDGP